jgi:predicted RNA-binding protein Jag
MYDARQEPNEFVADSLADARRKAAEFFGTDEGDLKIIVPKEGEIYGVHGQTVITAVPKSAAGRAPQSSGGGGDSRGEESRGGDRGPRREAREESGGGRGGARERGNRGDRNDRNEGRGEGRGRGRKPERGNAREDSPPAPRESIEQEAKVAVADSKGTASGKIGEVGEFLVGAVERMKLGSFELSESSEGDYLIFQLKGAAAVALQGGDGRATDALQLIANQVAMRQSEDAPRVVVDVEGGGDDREQTLSRLANRAVKRAVDTGRSIALDPMNSRDRRTIHVTIREIDGVETMSIGEGRYRQVLVVPEGAAEYEDALAESS